MGDGRGAVGAGSYPSLAGNAGLQSKDYVLQVVLKGLKGMPPVGRAMTNDQVAAVLTYVRDRFGGAAGDPVTAVDAASVRAGKGD